MSSDILLPLPFSLHRSNQNTDNHMRTHPTDWFQRNWNPSYDQSLHEMQARKLADILKTVSTTQSLPAS